LASNATDVTKQLASLSANVTTVAPGGNLDTVSWSNLENPSANNWIAMYAPTADDHTWVQGTERFLNGSASGSTAIAVPSTMSPGMYELRLYAQKDVGAPVTRSPGFGVGVTGVSPQCSPRPSVGVSPVPAGSGSL